MKMKGKVFVFGDNVNTDEIIPARYLNTSNHQELALKCMEDLRSGFGERQDLKGNFIVAGENFGCGSSREHAPISIKASGIACVIAKSFARIFMRNCINIGLPIVEIKNTETFSEEELVTIDLSNGFVENLSKKQTHKITVYPEFLMQVVINGGWINYLKNEMAGKEKL